VLCRHLPGGTEESHEKSQSVWLVSRPRGEPSISRIHVCSVTATLTCSVDVTKCCRKRTKRNPGGKGKGKKNSSKKVLKGREGGVCKHLMLQAL
jgi:hypothetical protein